MIYYYSSYGKYFTFPSKYMRSSELRFILIYIFVAPNSNLQSTLDI